MEGATISPYPQVDGGSMVGAVSGDAAVARRHDPVINRRSVLIVSWLVVVLVSLVRIYQIHQSTLYGGDTYIVWESARAFVHHRDHWAGYAYPPSSLLFVWPMGLLSFRVVRVLTLGVECVATFLSVVALVWMVKGTVKTLALPVLVVLVELFFPMFHTLAEMNFTFVIFVMFVGTLWFARDDRWEIAGVVLGCSIAIKPLLGPVVLAFILAAKWRGVIWSIGLPLVLNALVLPFIKDPATLLHNILGTYSQNATNPTIISIAGIGSLYHVPDVLIRLAQLVVILFGIGVLWLLSTRRQDRTTFDAIVEASTIGILVECLAFTFAWDLYLILLIPLAIAALDPKSLGRNPLLWIALILMAVNVVYGVPPGQELAYNRGQDLRMCLAMVLALVSLVPLPALVPRWDGGHGNMASPGIRRRPRGRAVVGPEA